MLRPARRLQARRERRSAVSRKKHPSRSRSPGRGRDSLSVFPSPGTSSVYSSFAEDFPDLAGPSLTDCPVLLTALYRESWLARRIIDMPCEDMTRSWYSLGPGVSPEELEALRRLEALHGIRREITDAIRWARLYGGSCALMVLRDQEDALDRPLDPDRIAPGDFRGLLLGIYFLGILTVPH